MKATEFCNYFEFGICQTNKNEFRKLQKEARENDYDLWDDDVKDDAEVIYELWDMQGVLDTRYTSDITDLPSLLSSLTHDYIEEFAVEDGFECDENSPKTYFEQMYEWMQNEETGYTVTKDVVGCIAYPTMIEDDTEVDYAV